MSDPLDLDELIAREDAQREVAARRDERTRALWVEADAAIRSGVGLVIELAKAASAVARGDRLPPLPRSPHDENVADERAERRREADRRRWHARKAERSAVVDEI